MVLQLALFVNNVGVITLKPREAQYTRSKESHKENTHESFTLREKNGGGAC